MYFFCIFQRKPFRFYYSIYQNASKGVRLENAPCLINKTSRESKSHTKNTPLFKMPKVKSKSSKSSKSKSSKTLLSGCQNDDKQTSKHQLIDTTSASNSETDKDEVKASTKADTPLKTPASSSSTKVEYSTKQSSGKMRHKSDKMKPTDRKKSDSNKRSSGDLVQYCDIKRRKSSSDENSRKKSEKLDTSSDVTVITVTPVEKDVGKKIVPNNTDAVQNNGVNEEVVCSDIISKNTSKHAVSKKRDALPLKLCAVNTHVTKDRTSSLSSVTTKCKPTTTVLVSKTTLCNGAKHPVNTALSVANRGRKPNSTMNIDKLANKLMINKERSIAEKTAASQCDGKSSSQTPVLSIAKISTDSSSLYTSMTGNKKTYMDISKKSRQKSGDKSSNRKHLSKTDDNKIHLKLCEIDCEYSSVKTDKDNVSSLGSPLSCSTSPSSYSASGSTTPSSSTSSLSSPGLSSPGLSSSGLSSSSGISCSGSSTPGSSTSGSSTPGSSYSGSSSRYSHKHKKSSKHKHKSKDKSKDKSREKSGEKSKDKHRRRSNSGESEHHHKSRHHSKSKKRDKACKELDKDSKDAESKTTKNTYCIANDPSMENSKRLITKIKLKSLDRPSPPRHPPPSKHRIFNTKSKSCPAPTSPQPVSIRLALKGRVPTVITTTQLSTKTTDNPQPVFKLAPTSNPKQYEVVAVRERTNGTLEDTEERPTDTTEDLDAGAVRARTSSTSARLQTTTAEKMVPVTVIALPSNKVNDIAANLPTTSTPTKDSNETNGVDVKTSKNITNGTMLLTGSSTKHNRNQTNGRSINAITDELNRKNRMAGLKSKHNEGTRKPIYTPKEPATTIKTPSVNRVISLTKTKNSINKKNETTNDKTKPFFCYTSATQTLIIPSPPKSNSNTDVFTSLSAMKALKIYTPPSPIKSITTKATSSSLTATVSSITKSTVLDTPVTKSAHVCVQSLSHLQPTRNKGPVTLSQCSKSSTIIKVPIKKEETFKHTVPSPIVHTTLPPAPLVQSTLQPPPAHVANISPSSIPIDCTTVDASNNNTNKMLTSRQEQDKPLDLHRPKVLIVN